MANFRGDCDDLESAVAEGFVTALYKTDLDDHALCARLIDGGRKAGAKQVFKDADLDGAAWSPFASRAPQPPWGHPDFVLVAAVGAGVLTLDEARLIGVTRLEHVPVKDYADWLGERPNTVVARRLRAENRLTAAITAGEMPRVVLDARFAGDRDVEARRNGVASLPPRRRGVAARGGGAARRLTCSYTVGELSDAKPDPTPPPATNSASSSPAATASTKRTCQLAAAPGPAYQAPSTCAWPAP